MVIGAALTKLWQKQKKVVHTTTLEEQRKALVNSNPKDIANLVLFGRATYKKMIQNLVWATGYNAIALPLATGFIPGLVISPAIGAVFMSLSTVIVAINAQLLKLKS